MLYSLCRYIDIIEIINLLISFISVMKCAQVWKLPVPVTPKTSARLLIQLWRSYFTTITSE